MMKYKLTTFLLTLLFSQALFSKGMDSLLNELARKDDLSVHTKKDTAGFITIFTREDLDRMKIRSLEEIIGKIPFIKNELDNMGLNDPYYLPYQISAPSRLRVFINDKELLNPLFGSGIRLLGQMDVSYIDHIEVYYGMPSYDIAVEPSIVVIKAYTKVGKRENTTAIGASIGNHGTYNGYAYKSEKLKDYSYFAYVNRRDLKRDKVYNLGSELSRDKETIYAYGQYSNETSSFEIQAVDGSVDSFAGSSWNMTPQDAFVDFQYLSSSYSYISLDKSLKASFNYAYLREEYYQSSVAPLGYLPSSSFPFFTLYNKAKTNTTEHLFDAKVIKKYKVDDTSYLFGLSNRFKKFTFNKDELDGVDYSSKYKYDSENIVSLFTEFNHQLNKTNQLILSLNGQKYFENDKIDNDIIYGTRIGHIYRGDSLTQKSFIFYGKFHPAPLVLLSNNLLSGGLNKLKSETAYAISTQSLWQINDKIDTSFAISRAVYEEGIYFDGTYKNNKDNLVLDSIFSESTYILNSKDKIDLNMWALFRDNGKSSNDRHKEDYGVSLSLYKQFYFLDTYNSITYVTGSTGVEDGWNYNATITYPYSKQLTFFLKGKNLLNKALTSNYISKNPLNGVTTELNNVSNIDRTVWLGLEYQF